MDPERGNSVPESRISSKGQTTLPKAVREALGVRRGDRLRYFIVDGEVRIRAVRPIQHLYGALSHDGPPVTLDDMQQAVVDGATDR